MIIGKSLVPQGQIFESSATKLKAKTLTDFSNKYGMFWFFFKLFLRGTRIKDYGF